MNKGTKKYVVRIPDDLMVEIQEAIASRNERSKEEPWSFSGFVRAAIIAKLGAMERGRGLQATKRAISLNPALTLEAE